MTEDLQDILNFKTKVTNCLSDQLCFKNKLFEKLDTSGHIFFLTHEENNNKLLMMVRFRDGRI